MPTLEPFCSNPKCVHHKNLVDRNRYGIRVVDIFGERDIERHMYVDRSDNEFKLCAICHEAINMLR